MYTICIYLLIYLSHSPPFPSRKKCTGAETFELWSSQEFGQRAKLGSWLVLCFQVANHEPCLLFNLTLDIDYNSKVSIHGRFPPKSIYLPKSIQVFYRFEMLSRIFKVYYTAYINFYTISYDECIIHAKKRWFGKKNYFPGVSLQ